MVYHRLTIHSELLQTGNRYVPEIKSPDRNNERYPHKLLHIHATADREIIILLQLGLE